MTDYYKPIDPLTAEAERLMEMLDPEERELAHAFIAKLAKRHLILNKNSHGYRLLCAWNSDKGIFIRVLGSGMSAMYVFELLRRVDNHIVGGIIFMVAVFVFLMVIDGLYTRLIYELAKAGKK